MTVWESCDDHLLAEVDDHSEDQGTGNVDPEILTDDNQLVHSMEFWEVGSHHVYRMVLATVNVVYLAIGIAGPVPGIWDQATVVADQETVDEDLVTGNLGPVTVNDHLPVAFGMHGYLCPWVGLSVTLSQTSCVRSLLRGAGDGTLDIGELDPAAGD